MSFLKDKYLALTIGDIEIDLSRSKIKNSTNLMGVVRAGEGKSFKLDKAFVQSLSSDVADVVPSGLSIDIKNVLVAESGKVKVLAANLGVNFDLSELPLVGKMLPSGEHLAIENFQLLLSTEAISGTDASALNGIVPTDVASLPSFIMKDANISATLNIGGKTKTLSTSSLSQMPSNAKGSPTPSNAGMSANSTADSQGNVNKTFGPIHIRSVSMNFVGGDLNFIIDASIAFGPLIMGFDGLEIGSPLSSFDPHASLKGLSLDYHKKDFAIEGAFLRGTDSAGQAEYSGMFALSMTKLQLTAIGSYTDDHGDPSLFIYGLMDEPLGGPAFCFVEGLALAFGYNRNFIAPPVADVSSFPLIAAAAGVNTPPQSTSGLGTMLTSLDQYIPPKPGEYFVGIGVKFMSFKVINSFALLIVKFGDELEFDILGESTYVAPNPKDPKPIATVEIEIVGSYKPALGTLLIRGQLTPNSFVLSKKCHLEGGFAIAMWFKGNYSGDFVYSFGGYSAHYKPPGHYPQNIPKLGFLWQVDNEVSIKGGGYWAITPKELMVGGYLKAAFTSSWVRAGFDIDAYFLITWSPLHYDGGFNVTFNLDVRVDLLFCSVWMGFEMGEGLTIHGPPFGGTAYINLAVCTVAINFGADPAPKPLLTGQEFREAFLPKSGGVQKTSQILSINIEKGLVKKEKDINGNEIYFINPKELHITTDSFVPCTGFEFNDGSKPATQIEKFEINPMGEDYDGTTNKSTHHITIIKTGASDDSTQFSITKSLPKNAPKSMWEQYTTSADDSNKTIVVDPDESKLSPLVFGADIVPTATIKSSGTKPVNRSVLANEHFKGSGFKWENINKFAGVKSPAKSITDANIDPSIYEYLDTVFDFGDLNPSDHDGLSARLKEIGDTEIFVGTLESAL